MRKDLTRSQQAVQGAHVVAEYLLRGPLTFWANGTLILLGVENEKHLIVWGNKLNVLKVPFVRFTEPDMGNQTTAIAVEGGSELFRGLKLL